MRLRPPSDDGHERYTTRRVVFVHPFSLGTSPEVYAAGAYDVETKEHALEANGHTMHVRTSTVLVIPTLAGICCREVIGSELDQALRQDKEQHRSCDPSENPDRAETAVSDMAEVLP